MEYNTVYIFILSARKAQSVTASRYWLDGVRTPYPSRFAPRSTQPPVKLVTELMDAIPLCDITKAYTDIYVNT